MKNKYDVIIIGAGISGLVCGSFLAKAGAKVLIIEKHNKPGGYCTSFQRNGYRFDVGPHSLGSCREKGQLGRLFRDLNLFDGIKLKRRNPSNIIIDPDYKVSFYNDVKYTLEHFQETFPQEAKKIKDFFDLLNFSNTGFLYSSLKNKTFKDLLDNYFNDHKLKTIFGLITGNLGLCPSVASAFTSVILYKEHIFDGGYYPEGGMQVFPNALAAKFQEYGGVIKYSSLAKQIIIQHKRAIGVISHDDSCYYSNYVVANCDATQVYLKLIEQKYIKKQFVNKLKGMLPSNSFFVVYVGLKKTMSNVLTRCSTLWYFSTYDFDNIYSKVVHNKIEYSNKYIVCGFPMHKPDNIVHLIILAPFLNKDFWENNKLILADNLIKRAEIIFPSLSKNIALYSIATPYDFYRYTFNTNGAISGWASIPSQIGPHIIPMISEIKNLFLTGHWTTSGGGQGGIPMVVFSGRETAKLIIENIKQNL